MTELKIATALRSQWNNRPDDERFSSLEELHQVTSARAEVCQTETLTSKQMRAVSAPSAREGGGQSYEIQLSTPHHPSLSLTHWSFSQLAGLALGPAGYLRRLDPTLAALCLNWGLARFREATDQSAFIELSGGGPVPALRALTSATYGRIFDSEVVEAVQEATAGGDWVVPAKLNPRAGNGSALYASDRDVFMFLVNEAAPITVDGETLYRGIYVWNSEVGARAWGLATFLYRYLCANRLIFGVQSQQTLRIRHTAGGPGRFQREGRRMLEEYIQASPDELVEVIHRAKRHEVLNEAPDAQAWLTRNRFSLDEARRIVNTAIAEEGGASTVWQLVQGATALARGIQNQDSRVDLEVRAGRLLSAA